MKFYSPGTRGFYDPAVHGARTIEVPDQSWSRPLIDVVLAKGETYQQTEDPFGPVIVNNDDEPMTLTDAPDWAARAPHVTVPNQECKIPADAVEITDEAHAKLLADQREGRVIEHDGNGVPRTVSRPLTKLGMHDIVFPEARRAREVILNRLTGIGLTALAAGDTENLAAIAALRQKMLDITKHPDVLAVTPEEGPERLRAVILVTYQAFAATAPASVRAVFKDLGDL